jgi:hypothetical protein
MADRLLTPTDAIGVLAVDATGKLKEEKVGARSTGKGAGIGAALVLRYRHRAHLEAARASIRAGAGLTGELAR